MPGSEIMAGKAIFLFAIIILPGLNAERSFVSIRLMRYFILTYGCQMNQSDSESIAFLLQKQGHKPAKNAEQAGLIVINACSVRQSAIDRVYSKIHKHHKNKKIILAGCVLETDKEKLKEKVDEFWRPDKYFYCIPFSPGSFLGESPRNDPGAKRTAFVPIMTGCNNFCSYCVVPYTRGQEKSRPAGEIIKEVKSLVKKGYKEIMLLGQNVNSYSSTDYSLKTKAKKNSKAAVCSRLAVVSFSNLLRPINAIPGNFNIKFLTSHPKDMSDELISAIAECKKVSREIHLPVQSGDNIILRKMNRKYTASHYKKLVKKIRAKIPDAVISTDIIVGFPGETKKQFQNTLKLCCSIKFAKAYISQYSPRFGTAAYKLKDNVPKEEKKKRWKVLNKLLNCKTIIVKRLDK